MADILVFEKEYTVVFTYDELCWLQATLRGVDVKATEKTAFVVAEKVLNVDFKKPVVKPVKKAGR